MIVITILLGLMLLGSGLFIFYLMQVLKNTYKASENVIEMSKGLDRLSKGESYDGKYYPGTVISNILFGQNTDGMMADFSAYETNKIIQVIMLCKETVEEHIKNNSMFEEVSDLPIDMVAAQLSKPTVHENVIVYSPMEGFWTWKPQE
jgi:hypothetical protein